MMLRTLATAVAILAPAGFRCPRCGRVSFHPVDLAEGYCGACHDWTGMPCKERDA